MEIRALLKEWLLYIFSLTGLWVIVVIAVLLRLADGPERGHEIFRMFVAAVLVYFLMRLTAWLFRKIK